jgi:hypothetical protein
MIIAIDEVGNFASDSGSFHYFIAVQLDQNKNGIEIKRQQFQAWLDTIPADRKNQHGEVKGKDLSDEQLLQFANQVIATDPLVRITQVRVIPTENSPELIEEYRKIEISRFEKGVELYTKNNRPRIAEAYQQLIHWYKNRNYEQYLKILILNQTIPEALRKVIGISILLSLLPGNGNDNLLNIKIKIDRDFINGPQPRLFFGELLRSSFRTFTTKYPIPVLDSWAKT